MNSKKSRLIAGLACAGTVILLCWFVLMREPALPAQAPGPDVVAEDANPPTPGPVNAVTTAARQPVDPISSTTLQGPLPTIPDEHSESGILSGRIAFVDGTPPPELTLRARRMPIEDDVGFAVLVARSEESARAGLGKTWATTKTDPNGEFAFTGMSLGYYALSLGTFSGLGGVDGTYACPSSANRVILLGYLLRVRVIGNERFDLPHAAVTAIYQRDSDSETYSPVQMTSETDEQGHRMFCLPGPGECTVTARLGDKSVTSDVISLRGAASTADSTLILDCAQGNSSLRITVRACEPSSKMVSAYCVALLDPKTGNRLLRVCSEDASPDGVVRTLPPGKYLAVVADRFVDPPALYFCDSASPPTAIELRDGEESVVELCVKLGGRISLLVNGDASYQQSTAAMGVRVELDGTLGGQPKTLYFRDPYDGGMRVLDSVFAGKPRISTVLLEEGTHNLLIYAPGADPLRKVVTIHAGEITEVAVQLPGG